MQKENSKKVILFICIVFLFLIGYFGYKAVTLEKYKVHTDENLKSLKSGFKIMDTVTVQPTVVSNSLTFGNVSFQNIFQGFEKVDSQESTIVTFLLKSTNEKEGKAFRYSLENSRVSQLKYNYENDFAQNKTFQTLNAKKILEDNKIENDIDLIKYLEKKEVQTSNLFTSTNKIKENYFFDYVMMAEFPKVDSITLIDGKYQGYVLNSKEMKEINILKDDKKYCFLLIGKDYNEEDVKNFLNHLMIK